MAYRSVMADRGIWFPAKRYGWGWGPPVTWQGWAVLIGWVLVFAGGLAWFRLENPMTHVFVVAMVAALIAVCWWKGERPRWRWGGDR